MRLKDLLNNYAVYLNRKISMSINMRMFLIKSAINHKPYKYPKTLQVSSELHNNNVFKNQEKATFFQFIVGLSPKKSSLYVEHQILTF